MKKTLFFITLCSLLLTASCNTDDDATPDTSNDHDILRCKINGQDWEPAGGDLFTTKPYRLEYYDYDRFLILDAGNSTENTILNGSIMIGLNNTRIGQNPIVDNSSNWFLYNSKNNNTCQYYHDINEDFLSMVSIIEIDTINYFIRADFAFSATNECQDTVYITDGYFDLNYTF